MQQQLTAVHCFHLFYRDYLFSGSSDTTIKVWRMKTLELFNTIKGHDDPVCTLACSESLLFSGSLRTIKVSYSTYKWVPHVCIRFMVLICLIFSLLVSFSEKNFSDTNPSLHVVSQVTFNCCTTDVLQTYRHQLYIV